MHTRTPLSLTLAGLFWIAAGSAHAAALVASYSFNNSLLADQAGVAALRSIDPGNVNGFETGVVNGQSRRVFRWGGSGDAAANQGGLSLNTTGLVAYDNYSVELLFQFDGAAQFGGGWRRIVDTQNRQSDAGFYVDPSNNLEVYPVVSGSTIFSDSTYHSVVMTNFVVNGVREVKAYLDGVLELQSDTDQLNLSNLSNPDHLLHFFVDNLAGPAQTEWAAGSIASLKLYDGIVVPVTTVPEPGSLGLVLAALLAAGGLARRSASAASTVKANA
jgi:hypothetical protein